MPQITIQTGRPETAAIIRTQRPYVLFEVKCDQAYVARLRYLSTHKGTRADGDIDVINFTMDSDIPAFNESYHPLVLLGALKIITRDLALLTNRDGSPRYPTMARAQKHFEQQYEIELAKAKEDMRRRYIVQRPLGFAWGGAEIAMRYRPRQFA